MGQITNYYYECLTSAVFVKAGMTGIRQRDRLLTIFTEVILINRQLVLVFYTRRCPKCEKGVIMAFIFSQQSKDLKVKSFFKQLISVTQEEQ